MVNTTHYCSMNGSGNCVPFASVVSRQNPRPVTTRRNPSHQTVICHITAAARPTLEPASNQNGVRVIDFSSLRESIW
jgi:hypothetical protein